MLTEKNYVSDFLFEKFYFEGIAYFPLTVELSQKICHS